MNLEEGQKLPEQSVAGEFERDNRAFEAFEEVRTDQANDLLLPVLFERIDACVRSLVPGERVVQGECEQRVPPRERVLEHVEQPPAGLANGVRGHLRRLALGEGGRLPRRADLALARVGAAALHDEVAEDIVGAENLMRLGQLFGDIGQVVPDPTAQSFLHLVEVRAQVVDAQRAGEVRLVPAREQLGHVPKVAQPVVDRRGGEHEKGLRPLRVVEQVVEAVVARWFRVRLPTAPCPGVAEVVRLVDHHDVRKLGDAPESLREVALAAEVRVAEDRKVAEVRVPTDAADVRQPLAQVGFPDALLRRLGSEEHYTLPFVQHQPLDQHQADKGLAEANPVAQERSAMLAGNFHERSVGLLLIAVDTGKHLRAGFIPLGRRQLVAAEVLLQRLRVDIKRRIAVRVARDGLNDRISDLDRLVPVRLEPLLKLGNLACALDLDIELDVLRKTRCGEVARPDQRLRPDHLELRVRDVRLRVELVLAVDTARDLTGAQRGENRRNAVQEWIGVLVRLKALVEDLRRTRPNGVEQRRACTIRRLGTHQNPDVVERLPSAIEGKQCADFEVPRRNIERLGDAGPLFKIAKPRPAGDAVVDDEEVSAFGTSGHRDPLPLLA